MKQVAVSVIVPVYKVEPYLKKCVQSLLDQMEPDLEIILVDDGSPDECPVICDKFAAEFACVRVIHKENGGVSSARNMGLDAATGKYVWFVDSDDFVMPDAIKTMRKHINADVDLLVFNRTVSDSGKQTDINVFMRERYFSYAFGFEPWNKLYKRSIIEQNHLRFDTQERIGEDLLFNAMYYKHMKTFALITDQLYHYVIRDDSAMHRGYAERPVQQMRIYEKLVAYYGDELSEDVSCGLLLMHLIAGLNQAKGSGMRGTEIERPLKKVLDRRKFLRKTWSDGRKLLLAGERASALGKIRVWLCVFFLRRKSYKLAIKTMYVC